MTRKKIFSARYSVDAPMDLCGCDLLQPDHWASGFLESEEDRETQAARLIEAAGEISMSEQLDMDIYDSPLHVKIDLILDAVPHFQSQMQAVGALLRVCDMLEPSALPDRRTCLTLFFNKGIV